MDAVPTQCNAVYGEDDVEVTPAAHWRNWLLPSSTWWLLLYAPTGRDAKRMTEATGFKAKTIHRLLVMFSNRFGSSVESKYDDHLVNFCNSSGTPDIALLSLPHHRKLLHHRCQRHLRRLPPVQYCQLRPNSTPPSGGVMPLIRLSDRKTYRGHGWTRSATR